MTTGGVGHRPAARVTCWSGSRHDENRSVDAGARRSTYRRQRKQVQGAASEGFLLNIIQTTSFRSLSRKGVMQVVFLSTILFGVQPGPCGMAKRSESTARLIDAVSTCFCFGDGVDFVPFEAPSAWRAGKRSPLYVRQNTASGRSRAVISLVALFSTLFRSCDLRTRCARRDGGS